MLDMVADDLPAVTQESVDRACADPVQTGVTMLARMLSQLDGSIELIKIQLETASRRYRHEGIKASDEWFRSAQKALRIKQYQRDRIARALDEARFHNRVAASTGADVPNAFDIRIAFYNAAVKILHPEDFAEIMGEAQKNIADAELSKLAAG